MNLLKKTMYLVGAIASEKMSPRSAGILVDGVCVDQPGFGECIPNEP